MSQSISPQANINTATQKIVDFVRSVGIPVREATIEQETFLPGIRIVAGEILYDKEKMLSPGDILHEAGHLAVISSETRKKLTDTVVIEESAAGGEEMGAIAWSWAALMHLELAPEILFHPKGYKGGADALIENFSVGRYIGVPILQWKGMAFEPRIAENNGQKPFPHMVKWTLD